MATTTATFVPNMAGIRAIASSPEMQLAIMQITEMIAAAAREIAPRSSIAEEHYADEIVVERGQDGGDFAGIVNAKNFKSNWIEFGTGQPGPTPAFAPLRRGAEAVTGRGPIGGKKR